MFRSTVVDPDYRRQPKTNCYCAMCQRDIKSGSPELWIVHELDTWTVVIAKNDIAAAVSDIRPRRSAHHYFDVVQFERVGSECARKIGKDFVMTKEEKEIAEKFVTEE